jgi:hypothetical protein
MSDGPDSVVIKSLYCVDHDCGAGAAKGEVPNAGRRLVQGL